MKRDLWRFSCWRVQHWSFWQFSTHNCLHRRLNRNLYLRPFFRWIWLLWAFFVSTDCNLWLFLPGWCRRSWGWRRSARTIWSTWFSSWRLYQLLVLPCPWVQVHVPSCRLSFLRRLLWVMVFFRTITSCIYLAIVLLRPLLVFPNRWTPLLFPKSSQCWFPVRFVRPSTGNCWWICVFHLLSRSRRC